MNTYNLSEAKAKFSKVMETVASGETVTLCKRNKPVAQVCPVNVAEGTAVRHHTRIGWAKGSVRLHDDVTEPGLKESDWEMLK